MESYHVLISFINDLFIRGLFISILSVIIAGKLFKTDIRNTLEIMRWVMISYAVLNIGRYVSDLFDPKGISDLFDEVNGPDVYMFYLTIIPNTIFPLSLLFKKAGRNKYMLLAMSVLMHIGWFVEFCVVYNYGIKTEELVDQLYTYLWFLLLKGLLVGGIINAIGNAITAFQRRRLNAGHY
ncbi:hypothetical protein D0C36_13170 [Mucilaginibacter conchicola]|uniref:Uncharacterized protein n=1 Tax=Mucilaginibacter conchicola TaxID=2303333 RepID=A0A372NSZ2_9SPHI|nr:hypothetical protein [Mucilaginibacter conchicola]RFZ92376.1 hypothetical protein D0C36_13170 [Mucilaginibacter conchicola]